MLGRDGRRRVSAGNEPLLLERACAPARIYEAASQISTHEIERNTLQPLFEITVHGHSRIGYVASKKANDARLETTMSFQNTWRERISHIFEARTFVRQR